jgi:hypothetical protein
MLTSSSIMHPAENTSDRRAHHRFPLASNPKDASTIDRANPKPPIRSYR